jgi:hypothetical protein
MEANVNYVLAIAWRLDADSVNRFENLYPRILELYYGVSVVLPPTSDNQLLTRIRQLPNLKLLVGKQPFENRRYLTIQQALKFETVTHIHYCDGDHVLSRMENHLDEWKRILERITNADCLIVGRTSSVLESYPRALRETEQIINQVGSYLLGQSVDLGSGSRGLSRRAVEYLMNHASPDTHGVATDAEWPVLLHQAGFSIEAIESSGAIYEITSADHRTRLESVEQWAKRVNLAHIIIQAGIDAAGHLSEDNTPN